jgi:hypothetical protein
MLEATAIAPYRANPLKSDDEPVIGKRPSRVGRGSVRAASKSFPGSQMGDG